MIRDFLISDITDINKLLCEFNYKLDEKSFDDNKFLNVLVYYDKKVKGVLVYQDLIDSLTLDYLIVDKGYRQAGIATRLLHYLEEKYKDIKNITLEVRESNNIAISFYEKNGFKKAAIRKNYYKEENGILMIKELR